MQTEALLESGKNMMEKGDVLESGGALLKSGGALVQSGENMLELGGALLESGEKMSESGGALLESGEIKVESEADIFNSEEEGDIVKIEEHPLEEEEEAENNPPVNITTFSDDPLKQETNTEEDPFEDTERRASDPLQQHAHHSQNDPLQQHAHHSQNDPLQHAHHSQNDPLQHAHHSQNDPLQHAHHSQNDPLVHDPKVNFETKTKYPFVGKVVSRWMIQAKFVDYEKSGGQVLESDGVATCIETNRRNSRQKEGDSPKYQDDTWNRRRREGDASHSDLETSERKHGNTKATKELNRLRWGLQIKKSSSRLKRKINKHSAPETASKFTCRKCGCQLPSKSGLKHHLNSHLKLDWHIRHGRNSKCTSTNKSVNVNSLQKDEITKDASKIIKDSNDLQKSEHKDSNSLNDPNTQQQKEIIEDSNTTHVNKLIRDINKIYKDSTAHKNKLAEDSNTSHEISLVEDSTDIPPVKHKIKSCKNTEEDVREISEDITNLINNEKLGKRPQNASTETSSNSNHLSNKLGQSSKATKTDKTSMNQINEDCEKSVDRGVRNLKKSERASTKAPSSSSGCSSRSHPWWNKISQYSNSHSANPSEKHKNQLIEDTTAPHENNLAEASTVKPTKKRKIKHDNPKLQRCKQLNSLVDMVCRDCGDSFRQGDLDKHSAICAALQKYECQKCDLRFRCESALEYHSKIHESVVNTYQYKGMPNKVTESSCLEREVRYNRITLIKPRGTSRGTFICSTCQKEIAGITRAISHTSTHLKSTEANEWWTQFGNVSEVKVRYLIKPWFECRLCKKYHIPEYKKENNHSKPVHYHFECLICDGHFVEVPDVNSHHEAHNGNVTYLVTQVLMPWAHKHTDVSNSAPPPPRLECWDCHQTFDQMSLLVSHCLTAHPTKFKYYNAQYRAVFKCLECKLNILCQKAYVGHLTAHSKAGITQELL